MIVRDTDCIQLFKFPRDGDVPECTHVVIPGVTTQNTLCGQYLTGLGAKHDYSTAVGSYPRTIADVQCSLCGKLLTELVESRKTTLTLPDKSTLSLKYFVQITANDEAADHHDTGKLRLDLIPPRSTRSRSSCPRLWSREILRP